MKLETSTNIWPIVCVGTYDGQPMDYEYIFGSESDVEDYEDQDETCFYLDDFDFQKWKDAIAKAAQKVFDERRPLEKYGVKVHVDGMWSPKEWNFVTDCLNVTVEVPDDFFSKAFGVIFKDDNRAKVEKYIADHWRSRDGFSSWMPETYDDLCEQMTHAVHDSEYRVSPQLAGGVLSLLSLIEGDIRDDGDDGDEPDYDDTFEYDIREYIEDNYGPGDFQTCVRPKEFEEGHGIRLPDVGAMLRDMRKLVRDGAEGYDWAWLSTAEYETGIEVQNLKYALQKFLASEGDPARREELVKCVDGFVDRIQERINADYRKKKEADNARKND